MRKILLLIAIMMLGGCAITTSTDKLSELEPLVPNMTPKIESSVSKGFTSEGGVQLVTDNKMGRLLNDAILVHWEENGYIESHEYVKLENFTEGVRYTLTLSGSYELSENTAAGVISGLTLMIIPNIIDNIYDLTYTLKDNETGKTYVSRVQETKSEMRCLLFIVVFPVSIYQLSTYYVDMAEHVYQDFIAQGAFQ